MRTAARSSRSKPTTDGLLALAAIAALGCSGSPGAAAGAPAVRLPPAPRASAAPGPGYRLSDVVVYRGACDASGAEGLPGGRIAVADDEDNLLRIYHAARGGHPVDVVETDLTPAGARDRSVERDLEGSAIIGSRIYWIASHGRKKSGKRAPSRLTLFASDIATGPDGSPRLVLVGRPYLGLLQDMIEAPALARYDLADAAARSPVAPGGLNIEGMAATPEGHLWLGFRNPVPRGRALVVTLENPAEVIERRGPPRFGAPLELALEGRGVRTIASWRGAYWIVGGAIADPDGMPSRLYRWDGSGPAVWIDSIDLGDLNVEAMATVTRDGEPHLLLVSDDGSRAIGGRRCKKLRDPAAKRFRAAWLIDAG
jgi:hypothetical protein